MEMAETIAAAPAFTVKMARRTLFILGAAEVQRSIAEEAVAQSLVFASDDYPEMKAARAEGRDPVYRQRLRAPDTGGDRRTEDIRATHHQVATDSAPNRSGSSSQPVLDERYLPARGPASSTASASAPCDSPGPGIWGEPADRDECIRVLRRAVELGVDLIDTADSYGPEVSEDLIFEALHPYPDGLVIATKAGLTRQGPGRVAAASADPSISASSAR